MPDVWIGWEYMHIKHIIIIIFIFFESNNYIEKNWQWDIGLGVIENNGDRKSLNSQVKINHNDVLSATVRDCCQL